MANAPIPKPTCCFWPAGRGRLSWKETAEAFRTSWERVFDAVEHVVPRAGAPHIRVIDAIGVDEIQYAKGHKYLTLVYQIDLGVTRLPG